MYRIQKRLFLVLIPLINVFNYYVTYNNIGFTLNTLLTFTLDTLEGYAAWFAVHKIIVYLDKRLPFSSNLKKRLIIQLGTTVFAGMFIIIALTLLIHVVATDKPFPTSFFSYDVFIISVWFLVINGIYIAIHFYQEWKSAETKRVEEHKQKGAEIQNTGSRTEEIHTGTRTGKYNYPYMFELTRNMKARTFTFFSVWEPVRIQPVSSVFWILTHAQFLKIII